MISLATLGLVLQNPLITRAHSHNDYMQVRPLDEALDNGFNSVEVDVFPVNGKLLVSHNEKDIKPERTIESMYLDRLSKRAKTNHGVIYPGSKTTFWVLVDVKRDATLSYSLFKQVLDKYPELKPSGLGLRSKVRFVISGERDYAAIAADKGKWAGIDGRIEDLDKKYTFEQMPWISGDWGALFPIDKEGPNYFGANFKRPGPMVKAIHAEHRLVRFWGASDTEVMWKYHWDLGIDLLNTDHISALRSWILKQH